MKRALGTTALAAAILLATAAPANAATPSQVELSVDGGVTWYTSGAPALFTDLGDLNPGASQSASVHVRNASSVDAVARVAQIVAVTASAGFVADLDFHARTAGVDGQVVQDVDLGVCVPLLDGQLLPAGGITVIDVTISLDAASTNRAKRGIAPIEFVVSLVEQTGAALPPVSCGSGASSGGGGPAVMARTGSDWMSTAATGGALAVALVGGGLLALLTGRRKRPTP